jgi:hypothetical protein
MPDNYRFMMDNEYQEKNVCNAQRLNKFDATRQHVYGSQNSMKINKILRYSKFQFAKKIFFAQRNLFLFDIQTHAKKTSLIGYYSYNF